MGDPGRKADQEVKLSCQHNGLGRTWPAAYFAVALKTCALMFIVVYAEHSWGVLATALS